MRSLLLPAFLAFTAAVLPPNASIGQDAGFGRDADVHVRGTLLPAKRHPSWIAYCNGIKAAVSLQEYNCTNIAKS